MKINTSELRQLYQEHLEESQIQSREKCPSPKTLLKFLRQKLPRKKRAEITDHLSSCTSCTQELKFVQKILNQEHLLNQRIVENLALKEIKSRNRTKFKVQNISWSNQKIVFLFTTTLLLIIVAAVFFLRLSIKHDYRGDQSNRINLIFPIDEQYSLSRLYFNWTEILSAEYYILEIYNEDLSPIWKSSKLSQNKFFPPQELLDHLEQNMTYLWMVKAFLKSGKTIESRLQNFTLKK